ncbi:MAG: aminotransferase class V-fold PLP-dependent enzyme [Actinomycetia bacterium]|nr:aminotransferase class V-fold PLP-dependent enzyme [Actinomycetes bacterium]
MSLRYGRPMVVSPGPSVIPDRVLTAMSKPMPNMYRGEIVEISNQVFSRLGELARTESQPFVVIGNGHAAWQMAVSNTLSRGDKVLAIETGRFAVAWANLAAVSGVEVEVLNSDDRCPADTEALRARLEADVDHELKAVLIAQTDTATSIRNDIQAVRAAIDATDHPALFMVDCIASLGCDRYEMDAWGADVTVAACQKGLMVPPGIAFVWANDKALVAYETADLRNGYFDWGARINPDAHYLLYCGTLPIPHLNGLVEALAMIDEEGGIDAVWARHEVLAGAVHAAVDAWSTPEGIGFQIPTPEYRSNAVTTVLTGSLSSSLLADVCEREMGLILGLGIGGFEGQAFRIGHMGHLNPPMILGTLGTIEAGLTSLGMPLGGSGVAAAANHIAKALSI